MLGFGFTMVAGMSHPAATMHAHQHHEPPEARYQSLSARGEEASCGILIAC